MLALISAMLRVLPSTLRSRSELVLENMALRHQLTILKRSISKPRLKNADRWFWILLQRCWPGWARVLLIVQPQTVIGWHRWGFRLFWRWKSRSRGGRPVLNPELVSLGRQMWSSNPTWGSKRIQAELAKLGIAISDSSIRKYRPRRHRTNQTWTTFLRNHLQEFIAVDFFTVPTASFRILYVFLVLTHARRKVLHFRVTEAPSAVWTAQQLTEAFAFGHPPRYLLRDRDQVYGLAFQARVLALGLQDKLIAPRSPWQNPFVERLIGSVRRECLDHVIVLNAKHLHRLLTDYFDYYHRHRPHRALQQDCPDPRALEPPAQGKIIAFPLVQGRHHRYARQAAA